jgi:carboxyl-terminal processing protease
LGINLLQAEDKILVVPLPDSPATRGKMKAAEYLLTLNHDFINITDFASYHYLADLSPGAKIPLKVGSSRRNRIYTLTVGPYVARRFEEIPRKTYHLIRIHAFHDNDTLAFKTFLEKILAADDRPLVMDLRYCPGGSLYAAIDFLSLFLEPELPVAYVQRHETDEVNMLQTLPGKILDNRPLALWLSPATASAAEIFTRALVYHLPDTDTVGAPTKGKCLAQEMFTLDNGGKLELSVARLLAADKKPCEGVPIQPRSMTQTIIRDMPYYQAMRKSWK